MRRRPAVRAAVVAAAAAGAALMAGSGAAAAGPHPDAGGRSAVTAGSWGTAQEVPGTAALNAGGDARISSVSCASAGNCGAGGYYTDGSGHIQAFVVSQTHGTWGTAQEVPGTAALNTGGDAGIGSVSCASAGNCSAGGLYTVHSRTQDAFVADERDGTWGAAQEVAAALNRGGGAEVSSVSCASAGNCGAGGSYAGSGGAGHAFVISEANGVWGTAAKVLGTMYARHVDSAVTSVSCVSPGNCSAAGYAPNPAANSFDQAFVAGETNGAWGRAQEPPGVTAPSQATINSVSCSSPGDCSAGGSYQTESNPGPVNQALVVDETDGTLSPAEQVAVALNKNGAARISSVSCASAGNCSAGGYYASRRGQQAFVISQVNGAWGKAQEVPGTAALNTGRYAQINSVSCVSAGNCSAGGLYAVPGDVQDAFVVSETDGTWGTAQEVATALSAGGGHAQISSVSCTPAGNCSAGGDYTDSSGHYQAFVVSRTTTAAGLHHR